jgi:hypothetical protein
MAIYTAPVGMRYTGTTAANSAVWAIRAGATKPLFIRRIVLFSGFDGTAAATSARHEIRRFRTATPSGGSAVVAVPKDIASGNSTAADIRQDTAGGALTVTSVTFDDPIKCVGSCPRGVSGAVTVFNVDFSSAPIRIDVNDGLCIRNSIVAVVGDSLAGFIEWEE